MKLLHLDASARTYSYSRLVSAELVTAMRELDPTLAYRHRDLAAEPVPHITQAWTEICDNLMRDGITALAGCTKERGRRRSVLPGPSSSRSSTRSSTRT